VLRGLLAQNPMSQGKLKQEQMERGIPVNELSTSPGLAPGMASGFLEENTINQTLRSNFDPSEAKGSHVEV